jgi:anti-anti-sigma factor
MDFEKTTNNRVVVLNVNLIRATLKEAEEFKNQLMNEIKNGNKKIVVNLTRCEFIDSTFLGSLVVALKKVTSSGGDLRLVGFQPAVNSMFELTRMYRVFESYETPDEAVKSFA